MPSASRPERLRLIDADDGHPDTNVHARGVGLAIYHATLDCSGIKSPEGYVQMTRSEAQQRTYKPCQLCIEALPEDERRTTSNGRQQNLANIIREAVDGAEANNNDPTAAALRAVREHAEDENEDETGHDL